MGISRGMQGGMASVDFGKTSALNSPSVDVGFVDTVSIGSAGTLHSGVTGTTPGSGYAADDASMGAIGSAARNAESAAKITDISVQTAQTASEQKVGPMLGFTPSLDNETHTNPYSLITITTPDGSSPAHGGAPYDWGPINDL
jgi:hypothetical protein